MNATADSGKQDAKAGTKPADEKTEAVGNTAVNQGDHDRVQMLSLRADGTPDQHNPEIIGDPEVAKALAREQFAQQAVSALDQARAQSVPMAVVGDELKPASDVPQDSSIKEAQDEHEKATEAAHKAADAMVDALHKGQDA